MLEIIIALLRARYTEENIREQTRLLEEKMLLSRAEDKAADKARYWMEKYPADAVNLAESQDDLGVDMQRIENKCRNNPKLAKATELVSKVGGLMLNAAVRLRKPKTDQKTIAIETEIIELISEAIKESQSQCKNPGAMAGMMQSMGMTPSPNGNPGLMPSDMNAADAEGKGDGNKDNRDDVSKAGGISASDLPAEFRDLLETYIESIEDDGDE